MSRTTMKQLNRAVEYLNELTGNPTAPYISTNIDGNRRMTAQVGNYHIDQCYGGFQLVQMACESGGIRTIQPTRGTKTDCWNAIHTAMNIIGR